MTFYNDIKKLYEKKSYTIGSNINYKSNYINYNFNFFENYILSPIPALELTHLKK